jgi:ABC-type transport system substrate-binding protein
MGQSVKWLKHLNRKLSLLDKGLISLSLIVFIVGITGLVISNNRNNNSLPDYGGTLIEGIVAKSISGVNSNIESLTSSALVNFDSDGNIVPGLAKNYTISPDGKTYTFTLQNGLSAQDIVAQIKNTTDKAIGDVTTVSGNNVVITLDVPFSPLLSNLTLPTLTPGPYFITKRSDSDILLQSNKGFPLGEPYISNIDIKIYSSQADLDKALSNGVVMAGLSDKRSNIKLKRYTLNLPVYDMLMLNLTRDPWKDVNNRRKLANYQKFDQPTKLTVTLPDNDHFIAEFNQLKKKYAPLNIKLTSKVVSSDELNNTIIPKRDFDALLISIDYGRDPDPYPFWHSSQIEKGQNISGFNYLPADKILEDARQTIDLGQRQKMYNDFSNILKDQVPAVMIKQNQLYYLVNRKVKGVKINKTITSSDRFNNIWQWYIKTKSK